MAPPFLCHMSLKDFPHCLTNKGKETSKILMFKHFSELGKIWYCSLGLPKIPISPTQDQHFKIQILKLWMNWEKLCPNLSFTVESKLGNSHKKKDGHISNLHK